MYVISTGVTVQGFGVRRYATSIPDMAALRMGNASSTVRDMVISDNATVGLQIRNDNNVVDNVSVLDNGQMGISGTQAYNLMIRDSVVRNNNTEHFKPAPVSGGIKLGRSRGVSIVNNDISDNTTTGFWCDESCYDMDVVNNTVTDNGAIGIELEISELGIVANNTVTGNQIGILLSNTGHVKVFNNEIGANTTWGLRLKMDGRRSSDTSITGHDPRRPNPDPTVPWITDSVVVSNNVFGTGGNYQYLSYDDVGATSSDQWHLTITGNLFNPSVKGGTSRMVGWGIAGNKITNYDSPADLAAGENTSWKNAAVPSQMPLASMLSYETSMAGVAVSLPGDVAAAIGQPAGARRLGTFA
jgi:parallel beta-helix repeat protein